MSSERQTQERTGAARKDLRLLGLDEWPVDAQRVRRTFRARLKQLHPDRNPRLRSWAERRTRELILAAERLLEQAEEHAPDPDAGILLRSARNEHSAPTSEEQLTVQLIRTASLSYAVPIDTLIAVVAAQDVLRSGLFGPYAVYQGATFPVETLEGVPLLPGEASAVLLFAHGFAPGPGSMDPKRHFALVLSREMRPLRIVRVSRKELIRLQSTEAMYIISADETFVVPGAFSASG